MNNVSDTFKIISILGPREVTFSGTRADLKLFPKIDHECLTT